ncbi:MAG: hypothetical protein JST00_39035 [Deltaproteobacteria bacterium]|nr:hypothetical protein [Deltaproteobacteria bacterium]
MPRSIVAAGLAAAALIACSRGDEPLSPLSPPEPPPLDPKNASCAMVGTPNPQVIGLLAKAWTSKEAAAAPRRAK